MTRRCDKLAVSLYLHQPDFFGFYSPDLQGFTGIGHSVEDCIYQARWGMREHVALLKEMGLPVSAKKLNPRIVIQNNARLQARQAMPVMA